MIAWIRRRFPRRVEVVTLPSIEGSFWTDNEPRSAERTIEALLLTRRIMAEFGDPGVSCGDDWPE